jgi:hypothetical protein
MSGGGACVPQRAAPGIQHWRKSMPLQVGETAPDFTLRDGTGRGTVSLSDFVGRPVVLAFYALAFTGG